MRFRFGTYSLKIKSYSAKELGLDPSLNRLQFNIYQKVFHFWYIPIFPLEKNGVIKESKTSTEFLQSTPEMRTALNLKTLKTKSPFWSYSGAILMALPILFLLGFFIFRTVDDAVDAANKNVEKNKRINLKNELVKTPEIDDLYTFKTLTVEAVTDMNGHVVKYKPSYFSSGSKVDYRVNYISKDSVGFEYLKEKTYNDYTYGLKEEFKISKKELISAIKAYQDLKIQKYPRGGHETSKKVVGIFEINRPDSP